jgi:hypothetical protein
MKKNKINSLDVNVENLIIDTNDPEYKWGKKHYNDPGIFDEEREWVDFDDSFINVKVGKHTLQYIPLHEFIEQPMETIVIVGKDIEEKDEFIVDKLVLCKFFYDGLDTYEIVGTVNKDDTIENKDGVIVLKAKKL